MHGIIGYTENSSGKPKSHICLNDYANASLVDSEFSDTGSIPNTLFTYFQTTEKCYKTSR